MKNVNSCFKARPQVQIKIAKGKTAPGRSPKYVQASAYLDKPSTVQPEKI